MKFESKVPSNVRPDTTLIHYLANRFTYHTEGHWRSCIVNGQVFIDDAIAVVDDYVKPGSTLIYDPGEFEEPAANLDYRIIFEDEWFLGINKPGNLLVHRAGRSFRNNLIYQIRYVHTPSYADAHTAHRLDRDTSGIVLVAKSAEAIAAVSPIFANQLMSKQYTAIVHGIPDKKHTVIHAPIGKKKESEISYKHEVTTDGKPASTEIVSVSAIGENHSLVTLKPLTGRTHQIRIHLAHIGNPIVGDKLYGLSESDYLAWRDNPDHTVSIPFYRHALHCDCLEFDHPFTNAVCRIEAPLPDDMLGLIDKLKV